MASTLNAVVGGVSISSDTSGALDIQTGGVNAISIGTGQTVTISNAALTNFSATSATITTLSSTSANITTLTGTSATITNLFDGTGNVRNIPQSGSAKTSSYTLVIGDIGEYIQLGSGGGVTIPDGVFSAGNAISIFNNTSGNTTITCSITTAYIAGTDSDKATMTLATRGVATILFISNSLCVVNGNVS
jgi:hypothetical protein